MAKFTTIMELERATTGALFYVEIDEGGRPYRSPNSPGAKLGNTYIRKSSGVGSRKIRITVEEIDE